MHEWIRGPAIGCGAFGNVFKAQLANGEIFAVKESNIETRGEGDSRYQEALRCELDVLKYLNHPNIVRCVGSGMIDGHLCVYLEYVVGGSLRTRLEEFGPFSVAPFKRVTRG